MASAIDRLPSLRILYRLKNDDIVELADAVSGFGWQPIRVLPDSSMNVTKRIASPR